jgi:hypothetical protein
VNLDVSQIFGIAAAIVGLAVISVAIINGDKTAAIIGAASGGFVDAITAATHPGTTASQNKK